jgi:hypothetical protein
MDDNVVVTFGQTPQGPGQNTVWDEISRNKKVNHAVDFFALEHPGAVASRGSPNKWCP